jgi:hypothetical protein
MTFWAVAAAAATPLRTHDRSAAELLARSPPRSLPSSHTSYGEIHEGISLCSSGEVTQELPAMQALLNLMATLLRCTLACFRRRNDRAIAEFALRQQLTTYAQARPNPNHTPPDRAFWVVRFQL